ncbi:FG-GAP repeat protein [Fluviicola taffensis DSM 16823]|uniref:FG-GAP repeat protein n=2 Tax=Fluviicola TaxID=332102 RepID=F2IJ54_FLUTR|nr:FG-GAP repeat protein [Fluviicola taffensis DSM 16823]
MIVSSAWSQTPSGCFSSGNDISFTKSNGNSRGMTKGDFDNDGLMDVVVAHNSGPTNYSFLKGLGNGKFGAPISGNTGGTQTTHILSSDFNNDGNLDIAIASNSTNYVSVLLGNGNGTFATATNYTITLPKYLAIGDINEDGASDIVVSSGNAHVSLLGSVGAPGTFSLGTVFNVAGMVSDLRLGDMDGDNHLDVVTAGTNGIGISLNTPGTLGTFATAVLSLAGSGPFSLTLCDVDNDADLDVVNTNKSSNTISVKKNNGAAVLGVATNYSTGNGPEGIEYTDFNGDGNKDFAVVNNLGCSMSIFYGSATGILTLNQTTQCPGGPRLLVIDNFNLDSHPDIITCQITGSFVNSYLGNGTNNYILPDIHATGNTPKSISSNDFNGDGKKDLIVANSADNNFQLFLGNGTGGFTSSGTFTTGTTPSSIISGDLDGDGDMDVITANFGSNNISIFYGNGSGAFSAATNLSVQTGPIQVRIGTLNADAFPDLVVANQTTGSISVLLSSGATSYNTAVNYTTNASAAAIAIFDRDADGDKDIVIGHNATSSVLMKFTNDGTGTLTNSGNIGTVAISNITALEATDLDGDADFDLIFTHSSGITKIYNVNGTGALGTLGATVGSGSNIGRGLTILDINSDGRQDVAAVYSPTGQSAQLVVSIASLTGTNAIYTLTNGPRTFAAEIGAADVAAGDFDGDGRIDLAVVNEISNSFNIHFNKTPKITAGGPLTFCNGNSVTLTSTPALWYDWDPNSETTQAISATATGNYYVTTSSSWSDWCSSNSNSISVTVSPGPSAPTVTHPGGTTICQGNTVTLSSSQATGNQWYRNGTLISGATNQTYLASISGSYTVTYTTAGCTSPQSTPIVLTVSQTPVITAIGPTTFCAGGSVILHSDIPTNLSWSPGGATTQDITVSAGGTYFVTNTVGVCPPLQSNSIVVTLAANLPTPTISPAGPIVLCPGGTVTLTSSSATNNIWSNGPSTQSIVVNAAGTYFVHLDNGSCASANSVAVTVTMATTPATPTITAGSATTFCAGGSVNLTSSAGTSYVWTPTLPTTQTNNITTSGSYSVQVTNAAGCLSAPSAPTVVTVNALPTTPTITAGSATTFCAGGSVNLTSSAGTTYTWSPVLPTTQTNSVTASGSYTVQTTNAAGCLSAPSAPTVVTVNALPTTPTITAGSATTFCAGGSVNLTSSAGTTYTWSPTLPATQTNSVTASGSYTVQTTNAAGCLSAASAPVVVTVNALPTAPTITPGGPTTFCAGGSVTLTSSPGTTYVWTPTLPTTQTNSVTASGSYTVQTTNAAGCLSAASTPVVVTVNALPTAPTITPGGPTTFCAGGSVVLTSSAGTTYTWTPTLPATQTNSVTASGSYTVQTTNAAGCLSAASTPVVVTVNALPTAPTITPGGPTTFCAGGSVTLTSSAGTTYVWTPTLPTTQTNSVTASGSYTVQVTNAAGCLSPASAPVVVTVNALPTTPTITPGGPTTFCTGGSVTLTSSVGTTYVWTPTLPATQTNSVTASGSYTVQTTNAAGCLSAPSAPTVVTVNALPTTPTITAGSATTFCAGGSVNLTSSAGTTYVWTPTLPTTQTNSVTASGSYTVQTTNAAGCLSAASAPVVVTVNALPIAPTITPGGATTFCAGGSVTLTSSAGTTYVWTPTLPTTQTNSVTASGSYTVQVTNAAGCLSPASTPVVVTVNAAPATPTITPSGPTTFCTGGSVTLTSSAGTTYTWTPTLPATQTNNVTASGSYTVQTTNAAGCLSAASAPVVVTVNALPTAPTITPGGTTTFCAGGSVVLTSSPGTTYSWSPSGGPTQTNTVTTSGSYTVQVTNAAGCLSPASTPVVVTVNAAPATPTITAGGPISFCTGGSVTLTSSAGTTYVWSPVLPTTQTNNITTSGSYTVQVTNAAGCLSTASAPVVVTVNALPATPTITPGGPTTFCAGGSVNLTSSAGTTYTWTPTLPATQTNSVTASGSYTVQVTNASGCSSPLSAPVVVTVNPLPIAPTITSGGATTFCAGGSVTLTSSAGTSYLWSPDGETTQSILATTSGPKTVQVGDANGCLSLPSAATTVTVDALPTPPTITASGSTTFCVGGSVTLTASLGTTYLWSPNGETTSSISVSNSGSYSVQVTNTAGCTSLSSAPTVVTVNTIPPTPTITAGGSTTFCAGGSVTLTSSTGTTYTWTPTLPTTQTNSVTASGSYTVQVTNAGGCTSAPSAPVVVTVNALPATPTITAGGSTTFCDGGSVALTSSIGTSYLWSPDGETTQSILATTSGPKTVQVGDANGCLSLPSAATTITENALPATPTITPSGPTTFCAGGSVTLTASPGVTYLWSNGLFSQSINVTTSGIYTVEVTNAAGCSSAVSLGVTITVNPLPTAPTITAGGPTTFCDGGSVTLTSSSGNSYEWSTTETTSSIVVTTSGPKTVKVIDANGCISPASSPVTITVNALPATPTITAGGPITFCAGGSVTLTASPGTTYLWSPNLETTSSISATTSGSYSVQVTNATGCTSLSSAPTIVTVNAIPPTPTITAGGPTTFCSAGGSVVLTSSASSGNIWSTTQTSPAITITSTGVYTVTQTLLGCTSPASAPVSVTVNPTPATPTISAGGPTTFCAGDSVILTSSSATNNIWSNGLTTQSITVLASGSYNVHVDNGTCSTVNSNTINVTVNAIPPTPTITAGGPTTFCSAGGSVVLTSSASSGNIWSTTQTSPVITVTTTGVYTVTQTILGCTSPASASVSVTVNPTPATPTISAGGPTTFCAGDSVILTSSSATNNIWSNGLTTQSITVLASGSYNVHVNNGTCSTVNSNTINVTVNAIPPTPTITAGGPTTFCSAGGSVVLTSSASSGNIWSTTQTSPAITVTTTGVYTVTQTILGCTSPASASVSVTVNPTPATPTISAGGPTTFCAGDSVILTSSSATNNIWSNGLTTQSITVLASGSYNVHVNNGTCSTVNSNTINVTVNAIPPTPTITAGGPTTFCSAGGSVVLTSSASSGNIWSTTQTSAAITVTSTGVYTVTQTILGCTSPASAPVSVTVNPTPVTPTISAGGPTTFCAGDSVILTSSSAVNNLWSNGLTTQSITVLASGSYFVKVVDGPCSSTNSNVINVTVNAIPPTPTITAGGPTTFCSAGGSVVLTSSASSGNIWSTTQTSAAITVTSTGVYTVTQTILGCTSPASTSVSVTVNPTPATPSITASGATTFCAGNTITLTSTSATGNLWSTGDITQSITVSASGTYFVKVVDGPCSSANSNVINVTVNPIPATPTITAGGPTTFCAGNSVVLTSSASTGNEWSSGPFTASITATTSGSYTVTQTLLGCTSAASAPVNLTVNPIPATPVVTAGGPTTFCVGGSVTLTSSVSPPNIQWSTSETTASINVTASGSYTVTQTLLGCTSPSSTPISVVVNPIPAVPTITASGPTTFCAGGSVTLTSSSATNNNWSNSSTNQSITITTSGTYTVQVIQAGCSSGASAPKTITVNSLPPAPTIVTGTTESICNGSSVTLTSSSTGGNLWNTTDNTQSIVVSTAGNYFVTVTDGNGCVSPPSPTTVVTVNPIPAAPVISANGPTSFCNGGSVMLSSSFGTGNLWNGGSTSPSITVSTNGTYTVTHTDVNGCVSPQSAPINVTVFATPAAPIITASGPTTFCAGGSVTLTSSATSGNSWSNSLQTQDITVTTGGVHSVIFIDGNGCASPSSLPVVVTVFSNPPAPSITAGGATTICQGSFVTLTSSATSGNEWSNGPLTQNINATVSGTYTVTFTNGNGCSATSSPITVTVIPVSPIPTISASGSTTICEGSSVTLTSSDPNSTWSTGATTQSIVVSTSGPITVTGNQTSCPSQPSAAVVVNVNPAPAAPVITPSGSTTICEGEELFLFTSGSGTNTWNTGYVGAVLGITTSGNYWVSVSNVYGCTSSSTVVPVVVNTLPTVTVDPFGAMCTTAAPFTMSNGSPAGGNYVGNGIVNNIFTPSSALLGPSIVTYTYMDLNGCANDAQTTIEVNDCAGINENEISYFSLFPNPNIGMFQVTSTGTPIEKIIIYDAQGKMIFNESYSGIFNLNFNLTDYSNGVYYIEINGENEIHDRMPLVINH